MAWVLFGENAADFYDADIEEKLMNLEKDEETLLRMELEEDGLMGGLEENDKNAKRMFVME